MNKVKDKVISKIKVPVYREHPNTIKFDRVEHRVWLRVWSSYGSVVRLEKDRWFG